MKGEAEAYAIEAKAKAEAEQMAKKADAWKEYREAAMVDMVLETMPKVTCGEFGALSFQLLLFHCCFLKLKLNKWKWKCALTCTAII